MCLVSTHLVELHDCLLTGPSRLILYYPVSALVTLFANILQNPNDARARSDVKLMNVVVNFLSTLVSDESNGSIKRMLTLCGEFERIAQVVLDKAERESHSKKKRKATSDDPKNAQQPQPSNTTQSPTTPATRASDAPSSARTAVPLASSSFPTAQNNQPTGNSPTAARNFVPDQAFSAAGGGLPPNLQETIHSLTNLGPDFEMLSPHNLDGVRFGEQPPFPTAAADNPLSSFQQPFVPQDLWQMPMTIEWDWADMSNNFPVFGDTSGPSGGPPNES